MTTTVITWLFTPNPGNDRAAGLPLHVQMGILNIALLHATERKEEDESMLLALNKKSANLSSGPDPLSLVLSFFSLPLSEMALEILMLYSTFHSKARDRDTDCLFSTYKQHFAKQQTNTAANVPVLS